MADLDMMALRVMEGSVAVAVVRTMDTPQLMGLAALD